MTIEPRILAFAGSLRTGSFNKKLAAVAAGAAREAGAEVTLVDLRDYPMPIYDGDIEANEGLPENARALKRLFVAHHGFLIASPEYNSSITGVLKNTIDWISRREGGEPALVAFQGKTAGLVSASPGALGGIRAFGHVRAILSNIGVTVVPDRHALSRANTAFDEEGNLTDPDQHAAVARVARRLVDTTRRLIAE